MQGTKPPLPLSKADTLVLGIIHSHLEGGKRHLTRSPLPNTQQFEFIIKTWNQIHADRTIPEKFIIICISLWKMSTLYHTV